MSMMTETRFEDLAAAYGADLTRWPAEERAAAEALRATSPVAQAMLAEAEALDAALDDWTVPAPTDALMARILGDAAEIGAAAQTVASPTPAATVEKPGLIARLFGDWGWRPAGAMAACLAIGFTAGLSDTSTPMSVDVEQAASVDADDEILAAFFEDDSESDPFDLEIL